MYSARSTVGVQHLLSADLPATRPCDLLPENIADGVDSALVDEEVTKMLRMCFDPSSFPADFDMSRLYDTVCRKIENAPDNDILVLPQLGDVQIRHSEELPTAETAVAHLSVLLSADQEVMQYYPEQLQQQAMFACSQDPFWGNQCVSLPTIVNSGTQQYAILNTPGTMLLGSWYSPQFGQCNLYAVPSVSPAERISRTPTIGYLQKYPIPMVPNIPFS